MNTSTEEESEPAPEDEEDVEKAENTVQHLLSCGIFAEKYQKRNK